MSGLVGAGRSEVAQALAGLHALTSGEIFLKGTAVPIRRPKDALANGIAYVPEERRAQGLFLDFPIAWNLSFASLGRLSSAALIDGARERALVGELHKRFDVRGPSLDSPVGVLSGGNQQKVLLARALACNPDVVLLDEPTRGVDIGARSEIYRFIDGLARQGKAVLVISSDMAELLGLADRILVMRRGRLVGEFEGPDFPADRIGGAALGAAA